MLSKDRIQEILIKPIRKAIQEFNEGANTNFKNFDELNKYILCKASVMNEFKLFDLLEELDGHEVVNMGKLKKENPDKFEESGAMDWKWFEETIRPNRFIYVRPDKRSISFTMQHGEGITGTSITSIIEAAKLMLELINHTDKTRDLSRAITKLDEAIMWVDKRRHNALDNSVEPINQL